MLDFVDDYPWTAIFLFCTVVIFGIKSCADSDLYKASKAANQAQEAADARPRVIREVDGCKVYAFKSDNWHYFTRCPAETTTDTGRTVITRSGKTTQSHVEYDSIVTTNGEPK